MIKKGIKSPLFPSKKKVLALPVKPWTKQGEKNPFFFCILFTSWVFNKLLFLLAH